MKTAIAILTIAFLAVTPAAASSGASTHAPGHHHKGVHGASSYAPGHVKKRMGLRSARTQAPGYKYERR
jgi:hypothetical protein